MNQLHVFFFPLLAQGHMIPTLEMAKLFLSRGVKSTIITTPGFDKLVQNARESGFNIGMHVLKFPPEKSDLPDEIKSLDQISDDLIPVFAEALELLQEPVEKLLEEFHPDCLVADMFFPWAADSAAKFDIPRLVFHGTCYLSLCSLEHMRIYEPFKNVSSDSEQFVLPDLPHKLNFTRPQVVFHFDQEEIANDFTKQLIRIQESETRSYGALVNSFYELEPDYADHYRKVLRRKSWHIGPLSLCNKGGEDYKEQRRKESAIDEHECLEWLNSKEPNSVVYICFGSIATFTTKQLHEIAKGLEISGQKFIWVVRKGKNQDENENWLPEGFEERTKDKGLIIRGWAPQLLILGNKAIGGFVTHCGWNSMLEGVCSGVPMVTWPVFAEQFFNEKLVTDVLRIGVSVGNKQWKRLENEGVEREAIDIAIRCIMEGEKGAEMRRRAQEYKEKARKAVEEDGSSYTDLSALLEELRAIKVGQ